MKTDFTAGLQPVREVLGGLEAYSSAKNISPYAHSENSYMYECIYVCTLYFHYVCT